MLINTKLEDGIAEKVDYLLKTTQLTLAEVLKNSINLYYELTRTPPAPLDHLKAFEDSGFIGCGEGNEQLSVNYKTDLFFAKS